MKRLGKLAILLGLLAIVVAGFGLTTRAANSATRTGDGDHSGVVTTNLGV